MLRNYLDKIFKIVLLFHLNNNLKNLKNEIDIFNNNIKDIIKKLNELNNFYLSI